MKKIVMMFLMVGTVAMARFTPDESLIEMKANALERLKKAEKQLNLALKTKDRVAINIAKERVIVELNRFDMANKLCNQDIYHEQLKDVDIPKVIREIKGE